MHTEEEEFLNTCAQCIKAGIRLRRAEEDALQARDIYEELLNNVQKRIPKLLQKEDY